MIKELLLMEDTFLHIQLRLIRLVQISLMLKLMVMEMNGMGKLVF
jgi:hypothetical protein